MATTSEAEKSKSEEAPPSFKAAVWEYFGFSGKYNEENKIVQFANIVMPLLATQVMNKIEPHYNVPSCTHFSNKVIPKLYETSRRELKSSWHRHHI